MLFVGGVAHVAGRCVTTSLRIRRIDKVERARHGRLIEMEHDV